MLGYVLERTQQESFYPYLERAVLQPMGLEHSAFRPLPAIVASLAKGTMWTIDGRQFTAPTFQLGMGPCGSMYSTVLDLGRFVELLFARGVARTVSACYPQPRSTRCGHRNSRRRGRRPDSESGSTSDGSMDIERLDTAARSMGLPLSCLLCRTIRSAWW